MSARCRCANTTGGVRIARRADPVAPAKRDAYARRRDYYTILKRVGELFPGPSKATRAYLHAEEDVEKALNEAGWKVVKREMTATQFYFSRLLEAVPM